jgi:hypothetical protein
MNKAIEALEAQLNVAIPEFTVAPVEEGNFFAHRWYLGCDPIPTQSEEVARILDNALTAVNDDYGVERNSTLQVPQVKLIPPSIFFKWQERKGKMGGQNKFPRVMPKAIFSEWETFVKASGY